MDTLLITSQDVQNIIQKIGLDMLMDTMITKLTQAFKEAACNPEKIVPRTGFVEREATLEWMPHLRTADQLVAIKVVTYQPYNVQTAGIPTVTSTTSLYDFTTGHLIALTDSTILTAMRTGAVSAIASKILAKPSSTTLGLVGAGAQAVTQLHALSRIFPLEKVLIYDIAPDVSHSFSQRTAFLDIPIRICALEEVEQESDILCVATTVAPGDDPVIRGEALKNHVHINAVGSDLPGKIELPLALLRRSLVCPDFKTQALVEGEC